MSTDIKLEFNSALQQHVWSVRQVESLLEAAVSTGHITTLSRGFSLFFPVSKQDTLNCSLSIQMTDKAHGTESTLRNC
jgi:hypothetical protein